MTGDIGLDTFKLDALVININHEHTEAIQAARQSLIHAVRAGDLLLQAKAQVDHDAWLEWIKVNCKFSDRTARAYMRLAENQNLLPANWQTSADLSIDGALDLITEPKPIIKLSELEKLQLEEIETKFKKGLHSFIEVGQTFKSIRGRELYKPEFMTFGEYCEKKWVMSLGRVDEFINISDIFISLNNPTGRAAIQALKDIESTGCKMTAVGMTFPDNLTYEQWLEVGSNLNLLDKLYPLPPEELIELRKQNRLKKYPEPSNEKEWARLNLHDRCLVLEEQTKQLDPKLKQSQEAEKLHHEAVASLAKCKQIQNRGAS